MNITKRNQIYKPVLQEFGSRIIAFSEDMDISGPFVPQVLNEYQNSHPKYFYCGQDTYGWVPYAKFINAVKSNQLDVYLEDNDRWFSVENIKEYSGNREGSFWTLVIRLHLFLRTQRLYTLSEISSAEEEILQEIGWGNMNSIEVPKTLQKYGRWESIDQDTYWKIKTASRPLDSIKLLLDSFGPDIIFIFNWNCEKKSDVFRDLNASEDLSKSVPGLLAIYSLSGYHTRVVWCPHPNNLRFKSQNIEGQIRMIASALA
jgi:hypothetical protein